MATRTVYACETCQPLLLQPGVELDPARLKALSASGPTKQFKSHCAPEAKTQVTSSTPFCHFAPLSSNSPYIGAWYEAGPC